MGIIGAHKLTHSISGVSIGELYQISLRRKKKIVDSVPDNTSIKIIPTIDIDASWIYRNSTLCIDSRISYMINLALEFSKTGFIVVFVCDGIERHHSKRATIDRNSKRKKSILDGYIKRAEMMLLAEKRLEAKTIEEVQIIAAKENALSNKIRAMEKREQSVHADVGEEFYQSLKTAVEEITDTEKGTNYGDVLIIKSIFQADSSLAYRCINEISEVVLCSDSDLAALAGSRCLGIKSFKYNESSRNNKCVCLMELYTPCSKTLIEVAESICLQNDSSRIKKSSTALFENVNDIRIRGLIAVGLGCDVYLSGIKQMGKSMLKKFIEKESDLSYDNLLNFYYEHLHKKYNNNKKKAISENEEGILNTFNKDAFMDAISIFVDAFIYEPGNWITDDDETIREEAKYMLKEKPEKLHSYLESFALNDPEIIIYNSITSVNECIGNGTGCHKFLSYEGSYNCSFCNEVVCQLCHKRNDDDKKIYCFDCFLSEVTVVPKTIVNQPSLNSMKTKLSEMGIEINFDDNVADVADMYDAIFENEKFSIYTEETFLKKITIPLHPSNYLDNEKTIFRFDLKNGGGFVRHNCCTLNNKHDLVCLFGALVQTGNKEFKQTNNKIYSVLPDILIHFAERSRLYSGYRLLKRAVRHAMDPNGFSILTSNCSVIEYNNTTGLHICHTIKASMKKATYQVNVSFTKTDIIAASCTCKAGSTAHEKILCVHVLPVIFQFSLLLFDGLAEHILCELANDLPPNMEEILSNENSTKLKEGIQLLSRANSDLQKEDYYKKLTISELLHKYKVGTEVFKKGPGPPANHLLLGPLRDISFQSPLLMAEQIIKHKQVKNVNISNNEDGTISINENAEIPYVPYKLIQNLIDYIKHYFRNQTNRNSNLDDCVGFKIIKHRSEFIDTENRNKFNAKRNKLLAAIIKANAEIRINKIQHNNNNLSVFKKKKCIDKNLFNGEESDYRNDENIDKSSCENNNKENDELFTKTNHSYDANKSLTKKYCYCAAFGCSVSSTNTPSTIFTNVPRIPNNKMNKNSSNEMFHTYHRKKFIRKQWLLRLGIPITNKNNCLFICNNHNLEMQETEYEWKDNNNQIQHTTRMITLPKCKNDPPLKTRMQHKKRKSIIKDTHPVKKTKTKILPPTEPNTIINIIPSKKISRYCSFLGCRVNSSTNPDFIKFCCIPKFPKALKENATNYQRRQHGRKTEFTNQYYKIIGIHKDDGRKDLRICNQHRKQSVRTVYHWYDIKNIKQTSKVSFDLPCSGKINSYNPTLKENRGLGIDRFLCNTINLAKKKIETKEDENLHWAMAVQQTVAMDEGISKIHPYVAKAVGLDVHNVNDNIYKIAKENKLEEKVIVRIHHLSDREIKSQTGFESITSLLAYIIILCNGDVDKVIQTITKRLTWFEEWYMYLEKCYSRSISRWIEYEDKYGRTGSTLRLIYDSKQSIALSCRLQWPRYVSVCEDEFLRNIRWNDTYRDRRVVMWDNTCIVLPKPQDPEAQRNTYSAYYAGNVGKGAIFIQLCGWMGTHELWAGAVSDSEYFERSGILEQQKQYIPLYDDNNKHIQWINILDKGYRVTSAAWRSGKQFVLQPSFARSDKKFSTIETLRSASIASDRGANERAVRLSKMSGQLHEGRTGNKSIERLSDLWLTWSFQCNFVYKPVL